MKQNFKIMQKPVRERDKKETQKKEQAERRKQKMIQRKQLIEIKKTIPEKNYTKLRTRHHHHGCNFISIIIW